MYVEGSFHGSSAYSIHQLKALAFLYFL